MLDERVISKPDVIAASHIVVKGGCVPQRIVLRKLESKCEFVVHNEYLVTKDAQRGTCAFEHSGFENGSYFTYRSRTRDDVTEEVALQRAMERFNERCDKLLGR